jgi:hypothetical protein
LKNKKGIKVAVFPGFASGSYKGPKLSKITTILPYRENFKQPAFDNLLLLQG